MVGTSVSPSDTEPREERGSTERLDIGGWMDGNGWMGVKRGEKAAGMFEKMTKERRVPAFYRPQKRKK